MFGALKIPISCHEVGEGLLVMFTFSRKDLISRGWVCSRKTARWAFGSTSSTYACTCAFPPVRSWMPELTLFYRSPGCLDILLRWVLKADPLHCPKLGFSSICPWFFMKEINRIVACSDSSSFPCQLTWTLLSRIKPESEHDCMISCLHDSVKSVIPGKFNWSLVRRLSI